MTLYVDTSALLKRYVEEPDSPRSDELLASDPALVTCRVTIVEVRRNLARLLTGGALDEARQAWNVDVAAFHLVELDAATCELAATIAEQTGARSLDALHLAAARRLGVNLVFLTFDVRQAQVARALGLRVVDA